MTPVKISSIEDCVRQNSQVTAMSWNLKQMRKRFKGSKKIPELMEYLRPQLEAAEKEAQDFCNHPHTSEFNKSKFL